MSDILRVPSEELRTAVRCHYIFSTLLNIAGLLLLVMGCSLTNTPESTTPTSASIQVPSATPEPVPPTSTPVQPTPSENTIEVIRGSITLFADPTMLEKSAAYLDLDTGEQHIAEGDIRFTVSGGSMSFYTLEPVNGGRANFVGEEEPGHAGCQQVADSLSKGNIPEIAVGHYLCAETNQGRLAQLRIDKVNPQGKNSLQVSFITWETVK